VIEFLRCEEELLACGHVVHINLCKYKYLHLHVCPPDFHLNLAKPPRIHSTIQARDGHLQ